MYWELFIIKNFILMFKLNIKMSVPLPDCFNYFKNHNINIKGILHVGAHECEELPIYIQYGISPSNIDWVEANEKIVIKMINRGISNIHCFAVDNEEGEAKFHVTNNGQSSSLLTLGTHKEVYPNIVVSEIQKVQKKKLTTFFAEHPEINPLERNFWVLDIQGSELNALRSAGDYLNSVDAIFSEINTKYVYEKCGLLSEMDDFLKEKGFKRVLTALYDSGWGDALWVREK
jgi:FkbM family methyltransferase